MPSGPAGVRQHTGLSPPAPSLRVNSLFADVLETRWHLPIFVPFALCLRIQKSEVISRVLPICGVRRRSLWLPVSSPRERGNTIIRWHFCSVQPIKCWLFSALWALQMNSANTVKKQHHFWPHCCTCWKPQTSGVVKRKKRNRPFSPNPQAPLRFLDTIFVYVPEFWFLLLALEFSWWN